MKLGRYTLIDLPVYVQPEWYEVSVNAVCSALMNHGKIRSVYRIGSVSAPGISDLDLVVIFKDGTSTGYDPRAKLDEKGKYLFVHPLFGACESHFAEAAKLTHFHHYRLIGGEEIFPEQKISMEDDKLIRRQTALEFLVKMYFVMHMQKAYRIIKVRSFLLEARALEYDLEFLDVKSGALYDLIQEIVSLRKKWFLDTKSTHSVDDVFDRLLTLLGELLSSQLQKSPLCVPDILRGKFTKNVSWISSPTMQIVKRGIPLPSFPARMFKKKYYNFQNRLTSFTLKLPVDKVFPPILRHRFEITSAMAAYNKEHIPNFQPLASSLRMI